MGRKYFVVNPIGCRAGKGGYTCMTVRFELPRIKGGRGSLA